MRVKGREGGETDKRDGENKREGACGGEEKDERKPVKDEGHVGRKRGRER